MTRIDFYRELLKIWGSTKFGVYVVIIAVHTIVTLVLLIRSIVKNVKEKDTLGVAICKSLDKYSTWVTVYLLVSTFYFASIIPFLIILTNIVLIVILVIYHEVAKNEDTELYQRKNILCVLSIWVVVFVILYVILHKYQ